MSARRHRLLAVVVSLGLTGAALAAEGSRSCADTVFRGGVVATMDARRTRAAAVAVSNGRVVYVGPRTSKPT